tara:strand:- start:5869 stop:6645 length:777 start_codon:yes stop_codon:yes gene_type:complete
MTTKELDNEFDIRYNSIATNAAPSIDKYEKSVYLTRAQLELVNNYFNPEGNKYKRGFEQSSKRRADLRELIRPGISTTSSTLTEDESLSEDSQTFRIPDNVYIIIQEKARVIASYADTCLGGTYIKVVPKTHDEFNTQENNPFKKPDETVVWRLDMYTKSYGGQNTTDENKIVELISPYDIDQYKFRYIVYPSPIILTNLLTDYPNEDLSIDGITAEQTCQLDEHIHSEIVNRAVELALADYEPQKVPQKVEINKRNE